MSAYNQLVAIQGLSRKRKQEVERDRELNRGFATATDMFTKVYKRDKIEELFSHNTQRKLTAKKEVHEMVF